MYPVSGQFIAALRKPHGILTEVDYTPPGGDTFPLEIKSGTVTADSSTRIRRRAALKVYADSADYQRMSVDGCLFRIRHGLKLPDGPELVPVFAGEIITGGREFGGSAGEVSLPLQDLGVWLSRADFVNPFVVTAGQTRAAAIASIVTNARPGTVVTTLSSGGTVGAAKVFTDSRLDAISALANDGGLESFFAGDGSYVIRAQQSLSSASVWTIKDTLKAAARARPMDRLYNTVVVKPSATDGSQTWTQQVAQVVDPAHPRHPSKIGVVPYFYASPTIANTADALRVANNMLARVLGTTETLELETITNPALEGGDVIRVITPQLNNDPADIFQHFTDGFTLTLDTGAMKLNTRSQAA